MTHEERAKEIIHSIRSAIFQPIPTGMADVDVILHHLREVEAEAIKGLVMPDPNKQWVKCSERMPTMEDSDDAGQIWLTNGDVVEARHWAEELPDGATHWRPTGLVRPEPPAMLAEREKETR